MPPDKIVLNYEIAIDIVWIERKPVLHIMNTHTHFQNAVPISSNRAEEIWMTFVEGWEQLYVGYPSVIRLDQETQFSSDMFQSAAEMHGIELSFSGVEQHNYIGVGERYQIPLRRVFRIDRDRYPSLHPEVRLRYAVKALNDTMGPEGTIQSLLAFGTFTTLPAGGSEKPRQDERMEVMMTARVEMQRITAELRVKAALKYRLAPAKDYILSQDKE